jgi:hypothetical protein
VISKIFFIIGGKKKKIEVLKLNMNGRRLGLKMMYFLISAIKRLKI